MLVVHFNDIAEFLGDVIAVPRGEIKWARVTVVRRRINDMPMVETAINAGVVQGDELLLLECHMGPSMQMEEQAVRERLTVELERVEMGLKALGYDVRPGRYKIAVASVH